MASFLGSGQLPTMLQAPMPGGQQPAQAACVVIKTQGTAAETDRTPRIVGITADPVSAERSSGPSAGQTVWAGIGQSGLTVSGVVPQPHPLPVVQTVSLPATAVPPMAPLPKPPPTMPRSPAELTIVTTGVNPIPMPEASRWTVEDREAALRAEQAYFFSAGGLLVNLDVGYDPNNPRNEYTSTGLSAMLTRAPETGTYYLAFRGTESLFNQADMTADAMQGIGLPSAQYEAAINLAQKVKQMLGRDARIILTGHSLGGGLAAAASYSTGLDAVVFNPASLNTFYSQGTPGYIRSHVVWADFLSVGRVCLARTAPGVIIMHPARTLIPPFQHSMFNFPEY
jgi:hypothetical protein